MESALDTIVAIASPPGAALRGILRVSGPLADAIAARTCGVSPRGELPPRALRLIRFDDGRGEQPGLLVWMRAPRSFTGDDVVEFHLPGNPHLLNAALQRVLSLGARLAGPGEFTRRAFLAGKIDLTRAEGVLLLVQAQDDAERRAGSALLSGELSRAVASARDALEELRALCEASLDFDESDTGHVPLRELEELGARARATLVRTLADLAAQPAEQALSRIVLSGAPNAGKSQLFNALCGAQALVDASAGTTRDTLHARLRVGEREVELVDTAGLERAEDELSRAAQERTHGALRASELALWVVDATQAGAHAPTELPAFAAGGELLLVWNQIDRDGARREPPPGWRDDPRFSGWVAVSGLRGDGLEELRNRLARRLERGSAGLARELSARHREALSRALEALDEAETSLRQRAPLELVAEGLRRATTSLDDVVGATTPEDVLERIFARFCIGK